MRYSKLLVVVTITVSISFFLAGCKKDVAIYNNSTDFTSFTHNGSIKSEPILITTAKISKDLFTNSGDLSFEGFNEEFFKGKWVKTSYTKNGGKLIDYESLLPSTMIHMGDILKSTLEGNKGRSIDIELIQGSLNPYNNYGVAKTSSGEIYKFIVK